LLGAPAPHGMSAYAARAKGFYRAKIVLMKPEIAPSLSSHRIGGLFNVAFSFSIRLPI
jgi:hypothetical protein